MRKTSLPDNDPLRDFQRGFKLASAASGLSMGEIANRLGVSAGTVSAWRTGAKRPHSSRLQQIADVCGVSLNQLLNPDDLVLGEVERERRLKNWFPDLSNVCFLKQITDAIAQDAQPLFLPGDILTVDRDAAPEDETYWLISVGDEWMIRKFVVGDPVRLVPVGLSTSTAQSFSIPARSNPESLPFTLLGKIVSVRRDF